MNVNSIDPLSLPSLPLKNRRSLPNCPAVYFVLAGERILYIGRAINLAQRWAAHHRWNQLLQFDTLVKIAWIECSEVQLLNEIEAALIEQFNPELNGKPNLSGKDRISVDVSDLRQEIEVCRNDVAWAELPLSAKIRVLVKERLEQIKTEDGDR